MAELSFTFLESPSSARRQSIHRGFSESQNLLQWQRWLPLEIIPRTAAEYRRRNFEDSLILCYLVPSYSSNWLKLTGLNYSKSGRKCQFGNNWISCPTIECKLHCRIFYLHEIIDCIFRKGCRVWLLWLSQKSTSHFLCHSDDKSFCRVAYPDRLSYHKKHHRHQRRASKSCASHALICPGWILEKDQQSPLGCSQNLMQY